LSLLYENKANVDIRASAKILDTLNPVQVYLPSWGNRTKT